MTINFEDSDYPETAPSRSVNPYVPVVQEMIDKGKNKKVTMTVKTDKDRKDLQTLVNYMQAAGRELNVTVNKQIVELEGGKTEIYFKVREAIKRTRLGR